MTDANLPAVQSYSGGAVPATLHSGGGMLFDPTRFEFAQRVANMFAHSKLIPQHLQGQVADCAIALHMAERLNEDPLVVMQNINIINGRAGWSAQYMIGRANRSGMLKGRICWRVDGVGDGLSVTAYAVLADTGEEISSTASMAMAKAEGWTRNSKYASMPEHMLRWRSATMMIRLYLPEVMLGIPTAEEVEDISYSAVSQPTISAPPPPRREDFELQRAAPPKAKPILQPQAEPPQARMDAAADPADDAAYELIAADGQALSWPSGQEADYVTRSITELRYAARCGRAALDGLWESNASAFSAAPAGVMKEIDAEHKRLLQVLDREEKAAQQKQQAAGAKTTTADTPSSASVKEAKTKPATNAAPAPATADDDLF